MYSFLGAKEGKDESRAFEFPGEGTFTSLGK
jgi:hypothetical protein